MQRVRGAEPDVDRLEPRLIDRFSRIDTIGAVGGIVFVAVVNGLFVHEPAVGTVVPFLAVLVGALLIAERVVDSNRVAASAGVMVGIWIVAIAVRVLFPIVWPVMILTVLPPLVLAAPYLPGGWLRGRRGSSGHDVGLPFDCGASTTVKEAGRAFDGVGLCPETGAGTPGRGRRHP